MKSVHPTKRIFIKREKGEKISFFIPKTT